MNHIVPNQVKPNQCQIINFNCIALYRQVAPLHRYCIVSLAAYRYVYQIGLSGRDSNL